MPLIGWTWYFLEIVFCKRKWEEDRDTVIRGLQRLSDYPEYMWVSALHQLSAGPRGLLHLSRRLRHTDDSGPPRQLQQGSGSDLGQGGRCAGGPRGSLLGTRAEPVPQLWVSLCLTMRGTHAALGGRVPPAPGDGGTASAVSERDRSLPFWSLAAGL